MRRNMILALVILGLLSMSVSAQVVSDVNLGAYYSTEAGTYGPSVYGVKKLGGGKFHLAAAGIFGSADNSLAFIPAVYIMEGGTLELAVIGSAASKWTGVEDPVYGNVGAGIYATYKVPVVGRIFGQCSQEWPVNKENGLEPTFKITIGVSLTVPTSP